MTIEDIFVPEDGFKSVIEAWVAIFPAENLDFDTFLGVEGAFSGYFGKIELKIIF